ncbi:MAG: S-methyl-5'-thioinosine phosphorylase [Proteobacteria bacterium]|nr:S-methyl-5'-thioinosine phosphorylase [Pseudomonadota bacterium]
MLAVIGGSGLTGLSQMRVNRRQIVRTPYGDPSGPLVIGHIGAMPALFLPRHGPGHVFAPHRVNYRANIWALRESGATAIVAVGAVGGIGDDCAPGAVVAPAQIIDYTWGREHTYVDGSERGVTHVDFTHPYSATLRALLLQAAQTAGVAAIDGGVYAATQGPRLESAAEIERLRRDGATLVGMTGMPEAALARELALDYVHLCVVSNWAAGRGDSVQTVSHNGIETTLDHAIERVQRIIRALADALHRAA